MNSKWVRDLLLKGEDVTAEGNTDLQVQSAVPMGENFASNIHRVKLKYQLTSGREKSVSAICKHPLTDRRSKDFLEVFETEIKVYSIIIPLMNNLMEEFSDSREKLWCTFYGRTENNTLVFEDLTESEFYTNARVDWLLEPDVTVIMKELGRFHAMSRILMERGTFRKEDYLTNNLGTDSVIWGKLYEGPLILLAEAMVKNWGPDWKEIAYQVKQQVPIVCEKMTELIIGYDRRFEVLNHGDVWTCNVMKRFNCSTGETSVRFIDFQQPCINSFIMDLLTFFHSSVDPSVRRNGIDTFLTVYAESLKENLIFFESKGYLPSLDDVKSEYKRMEYIAFVFSVAFFPVTTTKTNQPLQTDKIYDYSAEHVLDKKAFTDERIVRELKIDLKLFERQLL